MAVLKNLDNSRIIATNVVEATSFWNRAVGLLGKKEWPVNNALWIHRCNSIHTFFMKFPIDAVFVDKNLKIKKIIRNLQPGRLVIPIWTASSVFEFSANNENLEQLQPGDQLHVGH